MAAPAATHPGKALGEHAAVEVALEFCPHMGWKSHALLGSPL